MFDSDSKVMFIGAVNTEDNDWVETVNFVILSYAALSKTLQWAPAPVSSLKTY